MIPRVFLRVCLALWPRAQKIRRVRAVLVALLPVSSLAALASWSSACCLTGCGSRTGLDVLDVPGAVDAGASEGAAVPQACDGPVGEVVTLAIAPGPWTSLAVDATYVYGIIGGSDESSIVRVPRCAGATSVVLGSTPDGFSSSVGTGGWALAQGPAGVYWLGSPPFGNASTFTLSTVSTSGATTTLASLGPYASLSPWLAVGSTALYVALQCTDLPCDDGSILRVPLDGGAPVPLLSGQQQQLASVTADASRLYWAAYTTTDGAIATMPIGGGPVTRLVPNQPLAQSLTVQAGALYWLDSRAATLMTVPVTGGVPRTLATGVASDPLSQVPAFAVDANNVYFATGGSLVAVPLAGGAARTLAPAGAHPSIAVDGTNVYWSTSAVGPPGVAIQGTLMKLRPQ